MAKTQTQPWTPGEIWYIGFRPTPKPLPKPWCWFIKRKFSHCLAFRFIPSLDRWLLCEWSGQKVFLEVWQGHELDRLFAWIMEEGALISFEARLAQDCIWKFRMPFYCVSWVKHLLGLRNCWALTPYQLFCALKKRGGTVIFEPGE